MDILLQMALSSPRFGTGRPATENWLITGFGCCTVQFSGSFVSDSLWPHGLQHARLPCPSPAPRAYPNSCPSSWWCHPTISSSVTLFSCPQSLKSIRNFPNESALCIRWSTYRSFSINPSNEYSGLICFRMDWLDLLAVQGTLKSLLQHHSSKHQFFRAQLSLWSSFHIHTWLLEKHNFN